MRKPKTGVRGRWPSTSRSSDQVERTPRFRQDEGLIRVEQQTHGLQHRDVADGNCSQELISFGFWAGTVALGGTRDAGEVRVRGRVPREVALSNIDLAC